MSASDQIRRSLPVVLAFALSAAVFAACGLSVASPSASRALIAVPTQAPPTGGSPQACMAALLTGVLASDERWGVVVAPQGGVPVVKVIWPFGYAGLPDAGGIVLVDVTANGSAVARVGDRVEVAGGFLSGVDDAWLACDGVKVVPSG